MSANLLGIGVATPVGRVAQERAAEVVWKFCGEGDVKRSKVLAELFRMTRVRHRGTVLMGPAGGGTPQAASRNGEGLDWFYVPPKGEASGRWGPTTAARMAEYRRHAGPLAARACRAALEDAGVEAGSVTHLVTVSCTGFAAPGVDVELFESLRLGAGVQRVNVGFMGCHAAVNGLGVARWIAESDARARVLVCCVELCSLHFQYGWERQRLVSNALFADGAAAAVVGSAEREGGWRIASTASRLIGGTREQMTWDVEDHGFVMALSSRVPESVSAGLRPWLDEWLGGCGLGVEGVGSWAVHAGGPRIVAAVEERLGLGASALGASRSVLAEHGNMSSATVLFVLKRVREEGGRLPCVVLAFGPGLFAEAALVVG